MSQSRREMLAQRVAAMRGTLDQIAAMDRESLLSKCPTELRDRLSLGRFNQRLAMKNARKVLGSDLFAPVLDDRETLLLEGGAEMVTALSAAVGTHVLWQDVMRVVRRADLEILNDALGLMTRDVALRGRARDVGVAPGLVKSDLSELTDRIFQEGALSWACWLAGHDQASARRLRILTPMSVVKRVPRSLPEDADIRERRRLVVDIELNAMMGFEKAELEDQEVA